MKKLILTSCIAFMAISLNAKTLATVDGTKITEHDIGIMMKAVGGGVDFDKLPPEAKTNLINQVIDRDLLIKNAKKSGIEKDKEYLKVLSDFKDGILLDTWMKKHFDTIKVSDAEAKKYYDSNKNKFMQPKQVKARHILVKTEAEANDIIKNLSGLSGDKLLQKFENLAKTKSIDPGSGKNGGDLSWFQEGMMVKPFNDAAFSLKKGSYTIKPVKSDFGYHVILVEDTKTSQLVKFSEVKKPIEQQIKADKFRESIQEVVKKLREKAKIQIIK